MRTPFRLERISTSLCRDMRQITQLLSEVGPRLLAHNAQATMSSISNLDSLHVIYISRLAPDQDHRVFATVSRVARARNPDLDIGGVLLFDGESFCQWIHGPAAAVNQLVATIALDSRHVNFRLLHCGSSVFMPADRSWSSGFVPPFALDAMASECMGTDEVLSAFKNVLAAADV